MGFSFFGWDVLVWKSSVALAIRGLTVVTLLCSTLGTPATTWGNELIHAPEFTLPNIQEQPVSLADYQGQVVLLNFWATWCKDCAKEMPEFEKLYQAHREHGLSILAIALDKEGLPAVEAFLKKEQLTLSYPILLDRDGRVARDYRLSWVPVTIVVGRDGKIIETVLGARPWGSAEIVNSFNQLLKTREND